MALKVNGPVSIEYEVLDADGQRDRYPGVSALCADGVLTLSGYGETYAIFAPGQWKECRRIVTPIDEEPQPAGDHDATE